MNTKFDKNNNQNVNANKDMVNPHSHYQSESGLEVIDVIKAFTSNLTGIEATDTGNVLKYMCRWKNKNGVEDLKKAKWYLEHLIDNVSNKTITIGIMMIVNVDTNITIVVSILNCPIRIYILKQRRHT